MGSFPLVAGTPQFKSSAAAGATQVYVNSRVAVETAARIAADTLLDPTTAVTTAIAAEAAARTTAIGVEAAARAAAITTEVSDRNAAIATALGGIPQTPVNITKPVQA